MKIAFHDNSISLRGTTVALYDYAFYTRELIGNDSIILYDKNHPANNQDVYDKFSRNFNIYGYYNKTEIDNILYKENCSHLFMVKGGKPDGVISTYSKNSLYVVSGRPRVSIRCEYAAICKASRAAKPRSIIRISG